MKKIDLSKAATWWEVMKNNKPPKPVTIVAETEKTITKFYSESIGTSRIKKDDEWQRYFKTEKEALGFMVSRAQSDLELLKRRTNQCNSELHQLKKRLAAL